MGEKTGAAWKLQFDKRLRLEFQDAWITLDKKDSVSREGTGALTAVRLRHTMTTSGNNG